MRCRRWVITPPTRDDPNLRHQTIEPFLPHSGFVQQAISDNVDPVKHFLRRTTPSALKSAPFRSHWKLLPSSTKGSRVISQVELRPSRPVELPGRPGEF